MRCYSLIAAVLLASCTADRKPEQAARVPSGKPGEVAQLSKPKPPGPPLALYGNWVQVAPRWGRGDTLILRADSTARGLIPWHGELARITHWKIRYGSKDPVTARADWKSGYGDGGDAVCSFGHATDCVSMPMMCMGVPRQYLCQTFKFIAPDSLLLEIDRARFVRARGPSRIPAESVLE